MSDAAWLEISPAEMPSDNPLALDNKEVAYGSPLGRILAMLSDPAILKQKMPSGWQYSLRLSTEEAKDLKEMKIFRNVKEDHRSVVFEIPVSFRSVEYSLTLFIVK